MNYYYLHIWAFETFDAQTKFEFDSNWVLQGISNIGLEIDYLPYDPLMTLDGHFFCQEVLADELANSPSFQINTKKIRVTPGLNWLSNFPMNIEPPQFYKVAFNGVPLFNHFGIYNKHYLVVSELGLKFLRSNHVKNAESNLINCDLNTYFESERHLFWMPEELR
jgi:hypothetical protein